MLNNFIEYINKFMTPEELLFALFGLIIIVVLFIAGGKYEQEQEEKKKGE